MKLGKPTLDEPTFSRETNVKKTLFSWAKETNMPILKLQTHIFWARIVKINS